MKHQFFKINPNQFFILIITMGVLIFLSFSAGMYFSKHGVPFLGYYQNWSIGIYTGSSPLELGQPENITNPVLTHEDVSDVDASFVADPFLIRKDDTWYLFFEVLNRSTNQGDIGFAVSHNLRNWEYKQIILDEDFHLSFPNVFDWQGVYYMIPESCEASSVILYKSEKFPYDWHQEKILLKGKPFLDPSILRYQGKWWIFVETDTCESGKLELYFSNKLTGPWIEHPKSPIINGKPHISRPAGRFFFYHGKPYRLAQDCKPFYGIQVFAFEIVKLSVTDYIEKSAINGEPILLPGSDKWNYNKMHQLSAYKLGDERWAAAVDGFGSLNLEFNFSF